MNDFVELCTESRQIRVNSPQKLLKHTNKDHHQQRLRGPKEIKHDRCKRFQS